MLDEPRSEIVLDPAGGTAPYVALNWLAGAGKPEIANLGDALSPIVVAGISGRSVRHRRTNDDRERLIAIGTIAQNQRRGRVHVWGTGFGSGGGAATEAAGIAAETQAEFVVHATRGPLSAEAFRRRGIAAPAIYGDPAWFVPRLLPLDDVVPRFELGIVLHLSEVDTPSVHGVPRPQFLRYAIPPSLRSDVCIIVTYIDRTFDGIVAGLRKLRSCRRIVSSSFHGYLLAEAYGIPCAYFGNGKPGMRRLDPADLAQPMNERFRDFMLGVRYHSPGAAGLLSYNQNRRAPTLWDAVIRGIDDQWAPLEWNAAPLLDKFPLPSVVDASSPRWDVATESLRARIEPYWPRGLPAAASDAARPQPGSAPADTPAPAPTSNPAATRSRIPPSHAAMAMSAAVADAITEACRKEEIARARKLADDAIDRDGVAAAALLWDVLKALHRAELLGQGRGLIRHIIGRYGGRIETSFRARTIKDVSGVGRAEIAAMIRDARQGRAPADLTAYRTPRVPAPDGVGPAENTIALVPDMTFAAIPTPAMLGGHTPMSARGYWVGGFCQAAAIKEIRDTVFRWQASTIDPATLAAVPDAIFAVAGGGQNNYGHTIFQCLPSLYWYRALELDCRIVFPRWPDNIRVAATEAAREVMAALDIPWSRHMAASEVEGRCYALGIVPNSGQLDRQTVSFYRDIFVKALRDTGRLSAAPPHRRIYISRRRAPAHAIVNEQEIVDLMESMGFAIAEPETMPFIEQVRLFNEAAIVVGPHGSGFNNLFFATAAARLVEIRTTRNEDFIKLTAAAGQPYEAVWARPLPADPRKNFIFEQFDELAAACRRAIDADDARRSSPAPRAP